AASPVVGQGWELQALTVVLLGGVAFEGGSGRIRSIIYGLVFVGVLNNGLVIMGVSPYIQTTLVGLTLVMAVALDKGIQKAVSRSVAQNARRRQRRNGQTSSQDIERTEQATADVKE